MMRKLRTGVGGLVFYARWWWRWRYSPPTAKRSRSSCARTV